MRTRARSVRDATTAAIRRGATILLEEVRHTKNAALISPAVLADRSGVSRATVNRSTVLLRQFRIDAEQILMEGRSDSQLIRENARLRERMTAAEGKADARRVEIEGLKESVQTLAQQVQVLALDNGQLRRDLDSLERLRSLPSQ